MSKGIVSCGGSGKTPAMGATLLRIYVFFLPLIKWALDCLAPIFPKISELMKPRQDLMDRWRRANLGNSPIWFHVSSVGELEQVRPVIEILRNNGHGVVLSYFSNSVPRLVKDWSFVLYADYIPLDFPEEMNVLFDIIKPKILVLNRYDLWPNHLMAARDRNVPVVVLNASTPPLGIWGRISLAIRSPLFLLVGAWTFVDSAAASAWEPYVSPLVRGLVTGDPRVDRALSRAEESIRQHKSKKVAELWNKRPFCLVAGSTWPEDETILLNAWSGLQMDRSMILVPHEPEEAHLRVLEEQITKRGFSFTRFSNLMEPCESDILILDQRGILAEIYGMGQLAYVGGGFRRQIHSVIEPITHGLPVVFGPNFLRSPEAISLRAAGAAKALVGLSSAKQLERWIAEMSAPGASLKRAKEALAVFIEIHRGAGDRAALFLENILEGRR